MEIKKLIEQMAINGEEISTSSLAKRAEFSERVARGWLVRLGALGIIKMMKRSRKGRIYQYNFEGP